MDFFGKHNKQPYGKFPKPSATGYYSASNSKAREDREQQKEREHINQCKKYFSASNPRDALSMTSERYDRSNVELYNCTTSKTDVFFALPMQRAYLASNAAILAKRDYLANLNSAKNMYYRDALGLYMNPADRKLGFIGPNSQFNSEIIASKSAGDFQDTKYKFFHNTGRYIRDKKKSNFLREVKLNKESKKATLETPNTIVNNNDNNQHSLFSNHHGGGNSPGYLRKENKPSTFSQMSFSRSKSFEVPKSFAEDNNSLFPKNNNDPSSIFKSTTGQPNSMLFNKPATSGPTLFSKTGSTYGVDTTSKSGSSLFEKKEGSGPGTGLFTEKAPIVRSTWGKSTASTSLFQTKSASPGAAGGGTMSSLFQTKPAAPASGSLFKMQPAATTTASPLSGGSLFSPMKPTTQTQPMKPFSMVGSGGGAPSYGNDQNSQNFFQQKRSDAFKMMTMLIKNPFSQRSNTQLVSQFNQSYQKPETTKLMELHQILKNPYQLSNNSLGNLQPRTGKAPATQTRGLPTTYQTEPLIKRRQKYNFESHYEPVTKQAMTKLQSRFSTLLDDLNSMEDIEPEKPKRRFHLPMRASILPVTRRYQTMPSHEELLGYSEEQLSQVDNFRVISPYGNVAFLVPVDVRGMQIDKIINFEECNFTIYGEGSAPPFGRGLNVPFKLTIMVNGISESWAQEVAYENNFEVEALRGDGVVFRRVQ